MSEEQHPLQQFHGEFRPPSGDDIGDARFAPGSPAKHRYAVLYQGEYETEWDGTAAAVRLHARALSLTGIPVRLTSFSYVVVNEYGVAEPVHAAGLPPAVEAEVGHLRSTSATAHVPVIRHAVLRSAEHAHAVLIPRGAIAATEEVADIIAMRKAIAGSTILYSVWERDRIEDSMALELSKAGQLWVPCRQNAEILAKAGIHREKIHVVPHPYDPEDDICKVAELKRATSARRDWRLFYSIGRWEPRKGYAELVEAFCQAFMPTDKVMLTIKYSGGHWPGYPTPEEAVERALARNPQWSAEQLDKRLILLTGRAPRQGIIELHYRNNIYVASSHGEAYCLPAFEGLLSGNSLVAVPYGGIVDFMPDDDDPRLSVVMPNGTEPVPESYRWPPGTEWCRFSVGALVNALMEARLPERWELPEEMRMFEMRRVGAKMYDLVMQLADKCKPEAAEYFKSQSKDWRNQGIEK